MEDREQKKYNYGAQGLPPFPPGMVKPHLPQPPQLPAAGQPLPFPLPPMPAQAQGAFPDPAAAETARMNEEKERLEKKIAEMEKIVAQEKEKALVAALKNQQDEALSSKVESSLKDIQEKMRRDRRDSQVEEERISLKGKIKELESRLAQERETWMATLKNQLAERETQGRDVEGHFVYRLQEMERRWLDEKAQWQKTLSEREEAIRSLKSAAERLSELKDEFREVSLDKAMAEKEISKLRDDLARSDRERAAVENYIKMMPEKEREIAEAKAECSLLRMREDKVKEEYKHREEKLQDEIKHREDAMQKEMGRLQAELGTISDRKNEEKNAEIQKAQERFQAEMQEKDRTLADLAGEKMRAISELLKVKGFVSRVQAVNAAMDKERGQLRLEKMQLAQTMAAQMEDLKRYRHEAESAKAAAQAEIERVKNEYGAELTQAHREELSRTAAVHQAELSKLSAQNQADLDNKVFQLRAKYDAAAEEGKISVRRQLEDDYNRQLKELRVALMAAEGTRSGLELENRRLAFQQKDMDGKFEAQQREFGAKYAALQRESAERASALEAERQRLQGSAEALSAQKNQAEKHASEVFGEQAALREKMAALGARNAALEGDLARLSANFKTESENRVRFESEMLFLKQKIQQMEFREKETAEAFESERAGYATQEAAAKEQQSRNAAVLAELTAKLEAYTAMEGSLGDRLKWALKKKA